LERTNRQLFLKASTTSQLVGRVVETQLEQVGIPAFLLALLTHVRDLEPVSPTGVSLASGAPLTTLRDNIQRLVERRLVERAPNPDDGRSYLLVLTRRGDLATRAADPALLEAYLALEERLPRPLHDYERMLDELNEALEGARAALEGPAQVRTTG
jgi:MarR family transcriptional regulator, lower aerobic nicotinate degradation pathway regulator